MILVFDLDDTLYDESTFVDSGFAAVAAMLSPRLGTPPSILHERLRSLLLTHGRGHLFDLLLAEYGGEDPDLVRECVSTYRTHTPAISLTDPVRAMLAGLAGHRLYLVTDGDPDVQARKIAALGIAPYFAETYRTGAYGPDAGKPSLTCFELIRAREKCAWPDIAYVADDPSKDFVNLRKVGARTIRVHTGRCAQATAERGFDAEEHVDTVTEVPALLGVELERPQGG